MGVKCQPFHGLLWVLLLVGVKIVLHSYGFCLVGVKCQPFHWLLWVLLLVGVKNLLHSYGFYIGVGIDYQPISLEIE